MKSLGPNRFFCVFCIVSIGLFATCVVADDPSEISFSRQIRPILSDTCFKCHGPDAHERQADLRLDIQSDYVDDLLSAGDVAQSELYRRLITTDESELMPPPDSGRKLTPEQKKLIKAWIDGGAKWEKHWAFETPEAPALPQKMGQWAHNPVDYFVLERLRAVGLAPNEIADRSSLIRRVSLDLTGLPPSQKLLNRFLKIRGGDWYEQLIDTLMASDAYGEHMARFWLDAARYGDTHGLHLDNYREMWLYRDWVIDAFNENKPFDEFTTEQLAGDLLENPTDQQLIATGFNRCHVTTAEGGSIKEEVYVRNVVDRVSTFGTVFLGLTVGCAQCHDHKYDPISQQEFYELFAFFNSLDADPMDGNRKAHAPVLRFQTAEQKKQILKLEQRRDELESKIVKSLSVFNYRDPLAKTKEEAAEREAADVLFFDEEIPEGAKPGRDGWKYVGADTLKPFAGKKSVEVSSNEFAQVFFTGAKRPLRFQKDDEFFVYVFLDPDNPPQEIMVQWNDGNWEHRAYWGENKINFGVDGTVSRKRMGDLPAAGEWVKLTVPVADVGFKGLSVVNGIAFSIHAGKANWDYAGVTTKLAQDFNVNSMRSWEQYQTLSKGKGLPGNIAKIFGQPAEKWSNEQRSTLRTYFLRNVHPVASQRVKGTIEQKKTAEDEIKQITSMLPTTLIWKDKADPKKSFILERGEYDKKGKEVSRNTPEALPAFPEGERNRLTLARWLLDEQHPLTARVTVNRIWQQFFGIGLVETSEDFGAQGTVPSHPELLDWLASDFVDHGWDVKRLVKMILMSSAYRQSTTTTPQKLRLDPNNRLLSRGPRYRLDAESLRDQALAVSGLLVPKVGGPSVKPPQPDGLWFVVGYSGSNTVRFKKDEGHEKVHRRSLYTFWKRTAPPPQMGTFDAPSRESCCVRRERTNTPLQALLLMNDPQFVEAARFLAQRFVVQNGSDDERVKQLFRTALCRDATESELELLIENLNANRDEFKNSQESAKKIVAIGEKPADSKYDVVELASWTMLANLIMNMDEFVNK